MFVHFDSSINSKHLFYILSLISYMVSEAFHFTTYSILSTYLPPHKPNPPLSLPIPPWLFLFIPNTLSNLLDLIIMHGGCKWMLLLKGTISLSLLMVRKHGDLLLLLIKITYVGKISWFFMPSYFLWSDMSLPCLAMWKHPKMLGMFWTKFLLVKSYLK